MKITWLPPFVRNCTWHSYIQIKSTANIGESFDSFFCIFASAGFGRAWPLLRFLTAAAAGFSFALRCFCVGDEAGGGGCFFFSKLQLQVLLRWPSSCGISCGCGLWLAPWCPKNNRHNAWLRIKRRTPGLLVPPPELSQDYTLQETQCRGRPCVCLALID